jgi:hypothetical protein
MVTGRRSGGAPRRSASYFPSNGSHLSVRTDRRFDRGATPTPLHVGRLIFGPLQAKTVCDLEIIQTMPCYVVETG